MRVQSPQLPATLFGNSIITNSSGRFDIVTPGGNARITASLDAVRRVDVSRGHPRLLGALVGAGAGVLIGGALGAMAVGDDPEGFASLTATVGGAGAGLVFGTIAGFAYAPERWRTIHEAPPTDGGMTVHITRGAKLRRYSNDVIAVKGERDRRAGIVRGAAVLGGVAVVFGGIDAARGELSGGEYVSGVVGNAIVGSLIGYLVAPRGWQKLPAPEPASTR